MSDRMRRWRRTEEGALEGDWGVLSSHLESLGFHKTARSLFSEFSELSQSEKKIELRKEELITNLLQKSCYNNDQENEKWLNISRQSLSSSSSSSSLSPPPPSPSPSPSPSSLSSSSPSSSSTIEGKPLPTLSFSSSIPSSSIPSSSSSKQTKEGKKSEVEEALKVIERGDLDVGVQKDVLTTIPAHLLNALKHDKKPISQTPRGKWTQLDVEKDYNSMMEREDCWEGAEDLGFIREHVDRRKFLASSSFSSSSFSSCSFGSGGKGGEEEEEEEESDSETLPISYFDLKVFYEKGKTGLEESKDLCIEKGKVIAGRYQIIGQIGSAAFSKAACCLDLATGVEVCLKIIENNKDFLDQSLDEIKLLRLLKERGDTESKHVLSFIDAFYFKEHLCIVTELLRDNLYEFGNFNRASGDPSFFSVGRLKRIARQCLISLEYVHQLGIVHCDIKPENILIKDFSSCDIKLIDFGSSSFTTDYPSFYIQSRSYRAPEVIIGYPYGTKVDIWSLGCVLYELLTGYLLFGGNLSSIIARTVALFGNFPRHMVQKAKFSSTYFGREEGLIFEKESSDDVTEYSFLHPKGTSLAHLLVGVDKGFVHLLSLLLKVDPDERVSATEALRHPWLNSP